MDSAGRSSRLKESYSVRSVEFGVGKAAFRDDEDEGQAFGLFGWLAAPSSQRLRKRSKARDC